MVNSASVQRFIAAGPLPSEEGDDIDAIDQVDALLTAIEAPVSDEEAQNLAQCFGPDNCFGISWTLLHLIETAPNARSADYPNPSGNLWVELLNDRVRYTAPIEAGEAIRKGKIT